MKMSAGVYGVKVEEIFKDGEQRRRAGILRAYRPKNVFHLHRLLFRPGRFGNPDQLYLNVFELDSPPGVDALPRALKTRQEARVSQVEGADLSS
jgi:hypothetical protein